jgi:uncharacterized membrane protein AbrB (regulator of aidB expression)
MDTKSLLRILAVVMGMHLAALSFVFGPRSITYVLAAYLSSVVVWGIVLLVSRQKQPAGWIVGSLVIVIIQQVAYHTMKSGLPGFWWPLAQFFAVQFLIGIGVNRVIGYAGLLGTSRTRGG